MSGYAMTSPGARTQLAAVIGDPVRHSLSPRLHNAAYGALHMDWVYVAFEVAPGSVAGAVAGARVLGLRGLSVTTPHKQAALTAADHASPLAQRLGAANTLVIDKGEVFAESTDGDGLVADLRAAGYEPSGKVAAVIGAGGAARSAIVALGAAGASRVLVVNRSIDHAVRAAELAGPVGRAAPAEAVADAAVILQATPVGLGGRGEGNELLAEVAAHLGAGQLVYDFVYHPPVTSFLAAAANSGAAVRNGLGMLVHQAALQFELFCGEPAPLAVMWAAVAAEAEGA